MSEELKQDLKVEIDGLNSHMSSVKENADGQREEIVTLVRERAEMMQRMKEMEPLTEITRNQQAEIAALQQVSLYAITVGCCMILV